MLEKIVQKIGLSWRIPAYRRYFFYFNTCKNYMDLIRYERTKRYFSKITLRDGSAIRFQDAEQAVQIFLEIWFKRNYTRHYPKNVPSVVVDIGANIGIFSAFAKKLWPESKIYAYEPEEKNFSLLQSNIGSSERINNSSHAYHKALSSECGELVFYVKNRSGWHSFYPGEEETIQTTVQTFDFPNLLAHVGGRIDFLKIDCEGCEWSSIFTNAESLKNSVGYIAMEYHEIGHHTLDELVNVLKNAGFECIATKPDAWKTGMIYAKSNWTN